VQRKRPSVFDDRAAIEEFSGRGFFVRPADQAAFRGTQISAATAERQRFFLRRLPVTRSVTNRRRGDHDSLLTAVTGAGT
jgi:hypothetical protein